MRPYGRRPDARDPNGIWGRRRGRLEVVLDLLTDCSVKPGLPITRLLSRTNLCYSATKDICEHLIEKGLLQLVTLPYSYIDFKRETDYYFITEQGREIVIAWNRLITMLA